MKYHLLSILALAVSLLPSPAAEPSDEISEDKVYELMLTDYEQACRVMERLRQESGLPQWQLDITEGDLHFNNGKWRLALEFYTRASSSPELAKDAERSLELIHRRISCYDCLHDDVSKSALCKELYEKASEMENAPMQSIALFNLGKTTYLQENKESGFRMMEEAVEIMENADYEYRYDNLSYNFNTLILYGLRDGDYAGAMKYLRQAEQLEETESKGGREMDGLAMRQKRILLAYKTVILSKTGDSEGADKAYSDYTAAREGKTSEDYIIMPYLFEKGRYADVVKMNKARRDIFLSQGDSVNYYMLTINRSIANAYMEMGIADSAAVYYRELASVTEGLKKQEQESNALELAAIYESAQKDREIERQKMELKTRTISLVCTLIIIVLAMGFAVYAFLTLRKVRGKNTALANEVSDLVDCRQRLYSAKIECARLRSLVEKENIDEIVGRGTPEEKTANAIWEEIDRDIIENRLYLDHAFTRATVMERYRIPKNMFASVFKDNTGTTFTRYINNLRLEHSVVLMKEKPHYTINAIASECGFPNPSTFYRLFYERFSMTPSEYLRTRCHGE
ncbi:MAG: helix-turn-helix transcriptional regulator [Candidatus Cryptobacteroides sp.]